MNNTKYTFVANWKMYFSCNEAVAWCTEHEQGLMELAQKNNFVLCPSYEALAPLAQIFAKSKITLGAQNCSEHAAGAYTSQIMAQSLQELGVKYCLIGHSEVRATYGDTNPQLLKKMEQLIAHGIIPIFCLGETKLDYEHNQSEKALMQQLEPIIQLLKNDEEKNIFIAYEPVWAIGTGIVASNDHIIKVVNTLEQTLKSVVKDHTIPLLYGGTVTGQTIAKLKEIDLLSGFLIGKASTNFQELKKIVS